MQHPRCASLLLRPFVLLGLTVTGFISPQSHGQGQSQAQGPAQDSAFLSCARFEDRGQRIACLEDALEAAMALQEETTSEARENSTATVAQTPAPSSPPAPATTAESSESSFWERVRSFGQNESAVDISIDESGQDRLHDTITTLAKRNNLWTVTLASGQIWRQTYPRTLLLREGDAIEIYREGIGNAYRLSTSRLNGFIRVERVR